MRLTAAARRGGMSPALPIPYPALDAAGLRLRRGQVSLTVAAPGVGKSMLWLNFALKTGVPTTYWSADTDQHDVMMRALALKTDLTSTYIDEGYLNEPRSRGYYDAELAKIDVDWVFDSAIPAQRVAERLAAFAEMRGEYPHLVVLDNLSNAVENQEQEMAQQKEFIAEVQRLARFTRAHIAILAHAEGKYDDKFTPIPQSGVYNKLAKLPEIVLTMNFVDALQTQVAINIVKQRGGKALGIGQPVTLGIDYSRGRVGSKA